LARPAEINRNDVLKIHYLQRNQAEISDVSINIRLVAKSTEEIRSWEIQFLVRYKKEK